jgi:hypothetical protein
MTRDNKTNKTLAQQQREWDLKTNYGQAIDDLSDKQIITMTEEQLNNYNNKVLEQAINGINQAHQQAGSKRLSQFTTPELEQEILSRQHCQFGRLSCTEKAEGWIELPRTPTCFNCQQDILSLDHDK